MTATLIALISIVVGIFGANLTGYVVKKYSFGLIGNTIAGVFGSILLTKSFGRLGFDPVSITAAGSTSWLLFFLNIITSFSGGVFSIILIKTLQQELESSNTNQNRMINLFKITSFLEGLSYLLLLFVGVPFKYLADNDFLVKALGMPHGMLFLAYIVMALLIQSRMKWDTKTTFIVLIASLVPFGTFYVNKKFL